MVKIVFATNNPNKVREVQEILGDSLEIVGLGEIGCTEDIPETRPTMEGNALQKAEYIREHYQIDCFAEDTGLEVEALNGAPGVYTARYAGPERDAQANMKKLLEELGDRDDRKARFKTVIALIWRGKTYTFEGIVNGTIAREQSGTGGFGYDPVFIPDGYQHTFAELDPTEKNQISHRGRAVTKLVAFFQENH